MQTSQNISLKEMNTFHVDVRAKKFCLVEAAEDIATLRQSGAFDTKFLIIGCGADLLFTRDFSGLIIKSGIVGIDVVAEDENSAIVEVGSGVIWDEFVQFLLKHKLYGLENLAKIPSTVGAAPVQNIGAYGVEQKDAFVSLRAIRLEDGQEQEFGADECNFAYRSSGFKSASVDGDKYTGSKYFILSVKYRLSKIPTVKTEYAGLQKYMIEKGITTPTPSDVYDAVSAIRATKLPDPACEGCGNAGSFFTNPLVTMEKFEEISRQYPDVPHYPSSNAVKIQSAWLIENSGMKGERLGDAGVSPNHALILQNFGNASGAEILNFSEQITAKVFSLFGIRLSREVIVVD